MLRIVEKIGLAVLTILIITTSVSYACIIIPPPWPPHPPHPPWPGPHPPAEPQPFTTRYHSADITIKDQVAEVKVNATFYNPNPFRMEGTYMFPLPKEAAVKDFQIEINGKVVKGELLDAKKARETYEDIVRKQKDPALLEWVGSQLLKCRVFPIEANKETKIALSYTHMLKQDAGLIRLNYPLRSAKPLTGTIDQMVIKISIDSTVPIKTLYSPTHKFDISRKTDRKALLTLEEKNVNPSQNIEVLFSRDRSDVGLSLISHKSANEDGYFLLTVTPKIEIEGDKIINKNIVFVFDTSGSMGTDNKISQAKKALKFCINKLNKGDQFNIITFSGDVRYFKKEFVEYTDRTVKAAEEYIDNLEALGGTALNEALVRAMGIAKDSKGVPMIIFLTDGNPTIGEQNINKILKNVKEANKVNSRLFVFGVGYDVNTKLLDMLSEENHGTREYVKPKEDIEVKVSSFYTKVANPVLSDVEIDFAGALVDQVYPKKLSDLFHASQLTLLGRFKKPGKYTLKLTGRVGNENKLFSYSVEFKERDADDYLPRMWALRKVAFLLDEIRLHNENKELVDEVTRLGKLYGILTPYTSFLVIEEGVPVPMAMRRELEEAAGKSREHFLSKKTGRGAVQDSSNLAWLKGSIGGGPLSQAEAPSVFGIYSGRRAEEFDEELKKLVSEIIRHIGKKTFYVKTDGVWIDSTYDEKDKEKIVEIKLWSEEFFALTKTHPEIGMVLRETQKLIICLNGAIYRIQ